MTLNNADGYVTMSGTRHLALVDEITALRAQVSALRAERDGARDIGLQQRALADTLRKTLREIGLLGAQLAQGGHQEWADIGEQIAVLAQAQGGEVMSDSDIHELTYDHLHGLCGCCPFTKLQPREFLECPRCGCEGAEADKPRPRDRTEAHDPAI